MRFVRHVLIGFFLVIFIFSVSGCSQRIVCAPPNVLLGESCCLDADNNDVCDTWEEKEDSVEIVHVEDEQPVEPVVEDSGMNDFAETFAATWNRKSYTALHNLFVKDVRMKYSAQEFNFLARRVDAKLGITEVKLLNLDDDTAEYAVFVDGKKTTVAADIDGEDDKYRHEAFYFFEDLSAESACGEDGECFMTFAKISGDRNYCDKAGDFRADCVMLFGVSKDITAKIDDCLTITEYYGRADCLTQLAVKENDIEPCWQAGQDKQVFECMGEVAAARKDVDECPDFVASKGYPGTRLQTTYCILGYVRITGDTAACSKIDRRGDVVLGAMQEGCSNLNFP